MSHLNPHYPFDKEKIKLPPYLQGIITDECKRMLQRVLEDASHAFRRLQTLEELRDERYKAMCPRHQVNNYIMHTESLARLFNRDMDFRSYNKALSAKISADTLHFYVDRHAYYEFVQQYTDALDCFVRVAYQRWCDSKSVFEDMVIVSGITATDHDIFLSWWRDIFLAEMSKWEYRLRDLLLPSWEELVDDIYFAILERVDVGNSTVRQFYIGAPR